MNQSATITKSQEISDSIQNLIREYDRWVNDDSLPDLPTEDFDQAVDQCAIACLTGDLPAVSRGIVNHATKFIDLWLEYRGGDMDNGFRPRQSVWAAFNDLRFHFEKLLQGPDIKRVESVTTLRSQGCSDQHIAKAYGLRNEKTDIWEGPFFDKFGRVQSDLIEKQFQAEKGNGEPVIPSDWTHPINTQLSLDESLDLNRRLHTISSRMPQAAPTIPDKGTPEQLAREGAYPHQVQQAFNLTAEQTREIYVKLGLDPEQQPDLGDTPPPAASQEKTHPIPTETEESKAQLEQLVLETHARDNSLSATDIAREIQESTGEKLDGRKVAGILRRAKQESAV